MIFMYASGTRSVSMPSRAYTSFLPNKPVKITYAKSGVNALSGLYLISTYQIVHDRVAEADGCQCPLGLIPHFYSGIIWCI